MKLVRLEDIGTETIEAVETDPPGKCIVHDLHKIYSQAHDFDKEEHVIRGRCPVDSIAHKMSINTDIKKMEKVDESELSNYRKSLITGYSFYKAGEHKEIVAKIEGKLKNTDSSDEAKYKELLNCKYISKFNEAIIPIKKKKDVEYTWFPFTSLKYHSILVTNLQWNLNISNNEFENLWFGITDLSNVDNIFKIILIDKTNKKCFAISNDPKKFEASARLGIPMLNFGYVMSRLRGDIYIDKYIYANLRRINSWSVGLQYYDDVYNNDEINRGCI